MVDAIIKLFKSNSEDFSSNGVGYLTDTVSCTVTEELNGQFELELQYPVEGIRYSEIQLRDIVVVKSNPYSQPQAFRIYSISKSFNGLTTFNAQHISYDLSGYPVDIFTGIGASDSMSKLHSHMKIKNKFTFHTDVTANPTETVEVYQPTSSRSVLGGMEGSILERFGGEFEFDNFKVYLKKQRGTDNGVSIRYGKNLTDLTQEQNSQDVYTHVYPFYSDFDDEGDDLVIVGQLLPVTSSTYNFFKVYPLDLTSEFENPPSISQLNTEAKKWLKENPGITQPVMNLNVSFATLSDSLEYKNIAILEKVMLGDTVHVDYQTFGISVTTKCIKTVYNALTDKYDSVELGTVTADLATTISGMSNSISSNSGGVNAKQVTSITEKIVEKATGINGGYVCLRDDNEDGKIDELLVMDSPNVNQANKIWKFDYNGLSYSSTGRKGNFTSFLSQNGGANASIIAYGALMSKNHKIIFDVDNDNFDSDFFKIADDGHVELLDNPDNNVVANEMKNYSENGDLLTKTTLVDNALLINIRNALVSFKISVLDKEIVHVDHEGIEVLRKMEVDPYFAKEITFTSNGFKLKVGTITGDIEDFENTFTISRDSDGNIQKIKNTNSGLELIINRMEN